MSQSKDENILKGLLGAFLGSFVGLLIIVIFSNFGIVASISGSVMASLTVKYYKKFAGDMSKTGLIISVIVMIIMTLLALNISISLEIVKVQNQSGYMPNFIYIFTNIYYLIKINYINLGYYLSRLVLLYLFMFIGAYSVIRNNLKNLK